MGQHIGYLPQEVVLFEGTVAQNIARFEPDANDEDIIKAAKRTGSHEMILKLPGGYDFQVSAGGAALSGGQRQRIALARAFYGDPVVVVMDEPDSNLDAEGTMALARAVVDQKKRGGSAVIVAHRHGAFAQCDMVYIMEEGRPMPATRSKRKQPLRQIQSGGQEIPSNTPEINQKPVATKTIVRAREMKGNENNEIQEQAGVSPLPTRKRVAESQQQIPTLEQQIASAIERITSVRLKPDESEDGTGMSLSEGRTLSIIRGAVGEGDS